MGETYEHFYFIMQKLKKSNVKSEAAKGVLQNDGLPMLMHTYGPGSSCKVLRSGIDGVCLTYSAWLDSLLLVNRSADDGNRFRLVRISPKGDRVSSAKMTFEFTGTLPGRMVCFRSFDLIAVQEDHGIRIYDGDLNQTKFLPGECIFEIDGNTLVTGLVRNMRATEIRYYDNDFKIVKRIQGPFERPFLDGDGRLVELHRTDQGLRLSDPFRKSESISIQGIDKSIDALCIKMNVYPSDKNGSGIVVESISPSSDGGRLHTHYVDLKTGKAKFLMAGFCFGVSKGDSRTLAMAPMALYGPYKRGGRRCGSLYFMDLANGNKTPITQRFGQIHAGCWWANETRV